MPKKKLPGMGATSVARRGITGIEGTGAVGTAETSTEGAAGAGATGEARAVIPSPAAISGPLEVSASGEMSIQTKRKLKKKKREDEEEGRYIPIKSGPDEALPSSSESEIVLFNTGTSSGSSKMSADPSEDRSRSRPRVAEPGMEEGVTTSEALPFATWEISAKGSLDEITSGRMGGVISV